MNTLSGLKSRIINNLEKEFKFSKQLIYSETLQMDIELYIKENTNFVLCVNFTNLNSYINLNREIHSFFNLKGIKYNLINIFLVPTLNNIENTYFQTEFYEESIFIEQSTGKLKSFNIHNVGFLNVIKDILSVAPKNKRKGKDNHLTVFIVSISIVIYFILGSIGGDFFSIKDEVLLWAGGKMDFLIASGEYNRFFMAPFLHKNFTQLIVGIVTLFFTGSIVEKNIGRVSYLLLIISGIFFGNFMSYLINFSNVFGVGLYVINYAVIGALFILAFKHRDKVNKLFFVFIFSFIGINLLNSMFSNNIDNFGSLASFIVGILFMKILYLFKK